MKRTALTADLGELRVSGESDSLSGTASGDVGNMADVAGTEGGRGARNAAAGQPLFHPQQPLKGINKHTKTYTKHFYFKIYANDWILSTGGADVPTTLTGFQTVIPWHALCMYLSPEEYLQIVRESRYAKIKETKLQLEFKAVRTPFDANSADAAQANGNLQFEIQRWDGLESVLGFTPIDLPVSGAPENTNNYTDLINRLYGPQGFAAYASVPADYRFPATMRERGLGWRPQWEFASFSVPGVPNNGFGPMQLNPSINRFISSIPIGEYVTDRLNTNQSKMGEGYCFNKTYRPKNGLIGYAPTAYYNSFTGTRDEGQARINVKERMGFVMGSTNTLQQQAQWQALFPNSDDINNPGNPQVRSAPDLAFNANSTTTPPWVVTSTVTSTDPLNYTQTNDLFGAPYPNSMLWYSYADIENYQMFTSRNDPPIHHLESMLIGAVPKTNRDNSIVNATFEFECTTSIEVEMESCDPTYANVAQNANIPDTYPFIDAQVQALGGPYAYKWQHNETDTALGDRKYWNHAYGVYGKPKFVPLPSTAVTL